MLVLQVPAAQSESTLHCTQAPAMFPLVASPHTWFGGLLSPVQSVPVAALVKLGMSDEPLKVQVGLVWHVLGENGRSVASSTEVTPPEPLHTIFWQSPGL